MPGPKRTLITESGSGGIVESKKLVFAGLEGAYSGNTLRAWSEDTKRFSAWCMEQGVCAFPALPETVVAYIQDLDVSPATVGRRVASIAAMHRAASVTNPCEARGVRLALRAYCRKHGTAQTQAKALTWDIIKKGLPDQELTELERFIVNLPVGEMTLKDMSNGDAKRARSLKIWAQRHGVTRVGLEGRAAIYQVDQFRAAIVRDPLVLRDRALVLTAYDGLLRGSELSALTVGDLSIADRDAGCVYVARSKTDQAGQGRWVYISPHTVDALREWLAVSQIETGPVFRGVRKKKINDSPLSVDGVSRAFRRVAAQAGENPSGFSSHSARVGCAHDLIASGMELSEVMQAGRWKAPRMVMHYSAKLLTSRGATAKLSREQGRV